jgi:uncharacterized protein
MTISTQQPQILYNIPRADQLFDHCACPVERVTPTLPDTPQASAWRMRDDLTHTSLQSGYHLMFSPTGPASAVVLNESALTLLHSYRQPHQLLESEAQTLAALHLLQPAGDSLQPASFPRAKSLTAWLHLTNACNLNCSYCYINKSGESMDEATGREALAMLFQQASKWGFESVKLKYAGGEPTLNFNLLRQLHPFARQLSRQTGIGFDAVLLTNGVRLTPDMLAFIRQEGIALSISLDGLGDAHDRQRPTTGGQPSSQRVLRTIDEALQRDIRPHLTLTITDINADAIAEVAAFALERGLYFNLNFYRPPGADGEGMRAANRRLIDGVMQVFQVIEAHLPDYDLLPTLIDRASFAAPHAHTCGLGDNYLVIDHHGRIARCHMDMAHPVTNIRDEDPLLALRTAPMAHGFGNPAVDEKPECRNCPWRYWCAGGCPLQASMTSGSAYARSPYCEVYKAVFPELLRLQGLKLLREHRVYIH